MKKGSNRLFISVLGFFLLVVNSSDRNGCDSKLAEVIKVFLFQFFATQVLQYLFRRHRPELEPEHVTHTFSDSVSFKLFDTATVKSDVYHK